MAVKTFDSMQALCDYAVQQIVAQGGRCVEHGGSVCLYRQRVTVGYTPEGVPQTQTRHCAVGWVLDPEHEGVMTMIGSVIDVVEMHPDVLPVLATGERLKVSVLRTLQRFHDSASQDGRAAARSDLTDEGIDTRAPHWQAWIAMGRN